MKHPILTPALYEYMLDKSLREHPALTGLRKETSTMQLAHMQVSPEQAQFMQFLLRMMRAKNVLELGTYTGYSALAMSLALPDDGKVITCDISAEWTSRAHTFWKEAQQEQKIELRLGRALDTLHALIKEGWEEQFDFIFIDADKTSYPEYYEMALKLIHPRGVIAIDDMLWYGKVIDEQETRGQTREIRKLNDLIKNDQRVFVSLLPIADGLFLIQRT